MAMSGTAGTVAVCAAESFGDIYWGRCGGPSGSDREVEISLPFPDSGKSEHRLSVHSQAASNQFFVCVGDHIRACSSARAELSNPTNPNEPTHLRSREPANLADSAT
jgi:hypothetical protein